MNHISHIIGWIIMSFVVFVLIAIVYIAVGMKWTVIILAFSLCMAALLILAVWLITK